MPFYKDPAAWIAVVSGAFLGGLARFLLTYLWGGVLAVFICNVLGAGLLGFITIAMKSPYFRRFVCTGGLGTFTTYSTLMLLTIKREDGPLYLLGSLALGALLAVAGLGLGYRWRRARIYQKARREILAAQIDGLPQKHLDELIEQVNQQYAIRPGSAVKA